MMLKPTRPLVKRVIPGKISMTPAITTAFWTMAAALKTAA